MPDTIPQNTPTTPPEQNTPATPAAPAAPVEKPSEGSVNPPKPEPKFAGLDDELTAALKPTGGEPAKKEEPKEKPDDSATPVEPTKPDDGDTEDTPTETDTVKDPDDEDDYLLGPLAKKKDKEPEGDKPPEIDPSKAKLTAPELRKEYGKLKTRLAETEKQLSSIKEQQAKAVDDAERTAFTEEVGTLRKKLEEANTLLKTVAYEKTPEFKDKYERPFVDAWEQGVTMVESTQVQSDDGSTRQGTAQDFERIMAIPQDSQAAMVAQEMFGQNAFFVLSARRDLQRLNHERGRAVEDYQKNFAEKEKAASEEAQKKAKESEAQLVQNAALFKSLNLRAAEKHPEYFAPDDADEEGNALLAKGMADVDLAFNGGIQNLPNEKRVALNSAIRNRAGAFYRLVHQLGTKDSRIAELEKELAGFKKSTPGDGQEQRGGGADTAVTGMKSIDEELAAVARPLS